MSLAADIVGYVASASSISAFLPQIVKVVKSREMKGISTPMWVAEVITFILWTTYGILLGNVPIIITNASCLLLSTFMLVMKLVSRETRDKIADAVDPTT